MYLRRIIFSDKIHTRINMIKSKISQYIIAILYVYLTFICIHMHTYTYYIIYLQVKHSRRNFSTLTINLVIK